MAPSRVNEDCGSEIELWHRVMQCIDCTLLKSTNTALIRRSKPILDCMEDPLEKNGWERITAQGYAIKFAHNYYMSRMNACGTHVEPWHSEFRASNNYPHRKRMEAIIICPAAQMTFGQVWTEPDLIILAKDHRTPTTLKSHETPQVKCIWNGWSPLWS